MSSKGLPGVVPYSTFIMLRTIDKPKDTIVNASEGTEGTTQSTTNPSIHFLWISLEPYSSTLRFFILSTGVFVFYLLYGYFQELIFRLDGIKPFGWYLTLVQFGLYSVFGFTETKLRRETERRIPMKVYFLLSFLTVSTMGFSNSSVAYLNYPTQVMFKCCKLIPVLIGSILIQGKSVNAYDFVAAVCMSLGLVFFTLADVQVSPEYDTTGIVMISLALCADAAIGNVQEKNMKQYKATNTEVVLYSYAIGFVYILIYILTTGQLSDAIVFCSEHPIETYGFFTIFSLTGYLGIQLVLDLIKSSGVFIAVTVTTCRKALTIVLSFVFFTKPFTSQYLWSGLLVLLGIYLNIYSKNKSKSTIGISSYLMLENFLSKVRQNLRSRSRTTTTMIEV